MDLLNIQDSEIANKLDDLYRVHKIEESDEWTVIREAMRRVVDKHTELLVNCVPTDSEMIMQHQQIIKLYGEGFIPSLLKALKAEGEQAIEEVNARL